MKRTPRRDVFRCATWMRVAALLAAGLFLTVLTTTSRTKRPWTFRAAVLLAVVGCLGVAESFVGRVELGEHDIRVVELFRRRRYPRETISSVKWEKGGPVFLRLRNETWAGLPNTGYANTKVVGAIRAWLNEPQIGDGAVQQGDEADEGRDG